MPVCLGFTKHLNVGRPKRNFNGATALTKESWIKPRGHKRNEAFN